MILGVLTTLAAILPGVGDYAHIDPQPRYFPDVTLAATRLEVPIWRRIMRDRARKLEEFQRKEAAAEQAEMRPALASWYGDHGTGACGVGDVQSGYRFASLFLRCGTAVKFCYRGRCVEGIMSDHGPYVSGRTFDLNANLKAALGCSDLCSLTYRVG